MSLYNFINSINRIIKKALVDVFIVLCKITLPRKKFDDYFIKIFLKSIKLKGLKLGKTFWCFTHGFLPVEYIWYDLEHNDFRDYVPARSNCQRRTLNGRFTEILANKLLFEKQLKTVIDGIDNLHVVESIGYIEEGYLRSLHKDITHGNFSSLMTFLEKNGLIFKPLGTDKGEGIFLIQKENDHFIINNKKVSWDEMIAGLKNLKKDYLIQEKFTQYGFSNRIYPGSINTIRITTMIDPVTQEPFIAYAVHRFGSSESGIVDNLNQGGIVAMIDLADGKLSKALHFSQSGEKETYEVHPVSLNAIYNEQIPNWSKLKGNLIEIAARMPYLKHVGWDLILSNDELFLLEGNHCPGLDLIQMFKPMRNLPSAWNFFKHYKYVE